MTEITFDHIHIKSADPAASAQFYVEAFGALLVSQGEVNGKLRAVIDLAGVPVFIEGSAPDARDALPAPARGFEHLGLRVSNLDTFATRLESMGAKFVIPPKTSRPGVRVAFLYGPDGEYIELIERSAT